MYTWPFSVAECALSALSLPPPPSHTHTKKKIPFLPKSLALATTTATSVRTYGAVHGGNYGEGARNSPRWWGWWAGVTSRMLMASSFLMPCFFSAMEMVASEGLRGGGCSGGRAIARAKAATSPPPSRPWWGYWRRRPINNRARRRLGKAAEPELAWRQLQRRWRWSSREGSDETAAISSPLDDIFSIPPSNSTVIAAPSILPKTGGHRVSHPQPPPLLPILSDLGVSSSVFSRRVVPQWWSGGARSHRSRRRQCIPTSCRCRRQTRWAPTRDHGTTLPRLPVQDTTQDVASGSQVVVGSDER